MYSDEVVGADVAVALLQREDGLFLMQRRSLNNLQYPGMMEFPGGKQEHNEPLYLTLARELKEEVGVGLVSASSICSIKYTFPNHKIHTVHFFYVKPEGYEGTPYGKEGQVIQWRSLCYLTDDDEILPLNRAASLLLLHTLTGK